MGDKINHPDLQQEYSQEVDSQTTPILKKVSFFRALIWLFSGIIPTDTNDNKRCTVGEVSKELVICFGISAISTYILYLCNYNLSDDLSIIGILTAGSFMAYSMLITGNLIDTTAANAEAKRIIIRIATLTILFQLLFAAACFVIRGLPNCAYLLFYSNIPFTTLFIFTTDINLLLHIFTLAYSRNIQMDNIDKKKTEPQDKDTKDRKEDNDNNYKPNK